MKKPVKFQIVSFFILLALLLAAVCRLFLPYSSVLLWAVILYTWSNPWYEFCIRKINAESRWFHVKQRIIAGIMSIGMVIFVAGILFFFILKLIGQGQVLVGKILDFFSTHPELLVFEKDSHLNELTLKISLGTIDLSEFNMKKEIIAFLSQYTNNIVKYATNLAKNIGNFIISLIFISFALYFFYIDGKQLARLFVSAIPIREKEGMQLMNKFKDTITNLFKGYFLVSLCQFAAAFAVFFIFGVENTLLLSFLTFFSSFLPLLGCALVWLPVGIELCFTAGVMKGILFLLAAGVFISSIDNILRPMFLQNRIQIHPLVIFFSILGGVQVFKFDGIVLGPLFVILLFTVIDMAQTADSAEYAPLQSEEQ
ncbi:MAG: AI-2E family transporter [Treponema sp.]